MGRKKNPAFREWENKLDEEARKEIEDLITKVKNVRKKHKIRIKITIGNIKKKKKDKLQKMYKNRHRESRSKRLS